jgi:peptide subunit release factor 1 (eRF1)
MQADDVDRATLRRLARLHPDTGRVLSVFINLDPSEFPTGAERGSEIRSLLDRAHREAEGVRDLPHDDRLALRRDVERLQSEVTADTIPTEGAHGLALFACGPADLMEILRLPRPVNSDVVIDDSPFVEPLVSLLSVGRWCVLLVNRRNARVLRGSGDGFAEIDPDEQLEGQADEGLEQSRSGGSAEQEIDAHLKRVARMLSTELRRDPFDALAIGSPPELRNAVEQQLAHDVRRLVVGHIDIDVENVGPDDVTRTAAPMIAAELRRRERDALDRMVAGVNSGGRGTAGVDDTLAALNERRVEILLVQDGQHPPGVRCDRCGWIGPAEAQVCPVDQGDLAQRPDIVEDAIELALEQAAEVLVVRSHDDLEAHDGMGSVLRF